MGRLGARFGVLKEGLMLSGIKCELHEERKKKKKKRQIGISRDFATVRRAVFGPSCPADANTRHESTREVKSSCVSCVP